MEKDIVRKCSSDFAGADLDGHRSERGVPETGLHSRGWRMADASSGDPGEIFRNQLYSGDPGGDEPMSYPEIREEMEAAGYRMDDATYEKIVSYARRKAEVSGKDESYLPYLLPDVVREHFVRVAINAFTAEVMKLQAGG